MNEKSLLQSIEQMLDKKLEANLERILDKKLDEKLEMNLERILDKKLDGQFDRRFGKFEQKMNERFDKVDERLDRVDERFNQMDERFNRVEARLGKVELTIENELRPNIQLLIEGQDMLYVKMCALEEKYAEIPEKVEVLNTVARKHTKEIEQLRAAKTS